MSRQIHLARVTARPRRAIPGQGLFDPSVTQLRVHPGDLDVFRHVNNGVYLQMMDIARTNLIADLGGAQALRKRGWYPVVASSTVSYKRSLRLWDRFAITTRVLGWDPRVVYVEQEFTRGDQHVARAWVAGRFLSRTGDRVPAPDIATLLGGPSASPPLPEDVAAWARAVGVAHRDPA